MFYGIMFQKEGASMILNEGYLHRVARDKKLNLEFAQKEVLNENVQTFRKDSKDKYDIFLSHSYLDKTLVYAVVDLFNQAGYSVYVDWIEDQQLDRSKVTAVTANTLRKRMELSKSLAYVATSNSSNSKWCPWELGYVDASKNGRCAILPIMKDEGSTFKGQEYLGLYPFIDYAPIENTQKYQFWVNDPQNGNYVSLEKWLSGTDPYNHES